MGFPWSATYHEREARYLRYEAEIMREIVANIKRCTTASQSLLLCFRLACLCPVKAEGLRDNPVKQAIWQQGWNRPVDKPRWNERVATPRPWCGQDSVDKVTKLLR